MIELTKECVTCKKELPFTEFSRDRTAKHGFKYNCKCCRASRRKELDLLNPEVLILQRKRTYSINKDKRLLENKQNYIKNKAKHIAKARKYDLSKINRTPTWVSKKDMKKVETLYLLSDRLTRCLQLSFHVDHEIPLRGKRVSGLHIFENLRVIPATTNLQKGNKWQIY